MASCNTRYCTYLYNQYPLLEGAQDGGAQVKSVGKNGTSLSRALANLSAVSSSGGCVSRDIQPSTVAIYCEITRQAVLMTHPFQLKYIRTNPELTTFHGDLNTFEMRRVLLVSTLIIVMIKLANGIRRPDVSFHLPGHEIRNH